MLVKSSTFYISPSSDEGCYPNVSNLSEVIVNVSDLNISLILMPGNHSLGSDFNVIGVEEFSLKSHLPAVINCGVSVGLQFNLTTHVHIQGITFNGCLDTKIWSVDNFTIENSTFVAVNSLVYNGRAMVVTSSTVILTNCHFISFHADKQNGGAIYSMSSYPSQCL
jgi:hypothetical protein